MGDIQFFNQIEIVLPSIPMITSRTTGLQTLIRFKLRPVVLIAALNLVRSGCHTPRKIRWEFERVKILLAPINMRLWVSQTQKQDGQDIGTSGNQDHLPPEHVTCYALFLITTSTCLAALECRNPLENEEYCKREQSEATDSNRPKQSTITHPIL
ncbi:MAG: Uncharacterised protein [Marine Group II euryarchaeote MED-G33]|nr:MAG: Uncharacterised protein [Marine Group II euryarchaeote MED-G33]